MIRRVSKRIQQAVACMVPCLLLLLGSPVAISQDNPPPEPTKKTQAISAKVYEKLAKAQEAAEAKQYNQAINILNKLNPSSLKGYDAASVWNVYGFVYYSQEQYRRAIDAYKKVLAQQEIPQALRVGTQYTVAQLCFVLEDYGCAVREMNNWFKVAQNPGPDPYFLLAQGYYQRRDSNNALRWAEKGMTVARQKEIAPKEHWYLLQRVLYYDKNDYKKTANVLEQLLRRWPKREYLVQLSGMYGELKQEKKQLVLMETAFEQGMLNSEGEYLNMAYLYLGADMPYKAGKVIDKGISEGKITGSSRNYETLGNAWVQAQESKRAIPALEKAAANSSKGEISARLASVYLDLEEYAKSERAGLAALNKGGLKRSDTVHMVVGMARFNQDKLQSAKQSFARCARDQRSEKTCVQWQNYVSSEQSRRQKLAEDLRALERIRQGLPAEEVPAEEAEQASGEDTASTAGQGESEAS